MALDGPAAPGSDRDVADGLVRQGVLAEADLLRAIGLAEASGTPIGAVLDRLGLVSQRHWAQAVAEGLGLAVLGRDEFPWDPPHPPRLAFDFQEQSGLALVALDEAQAHVAIGDPIGPYVEKALRLALRRDVVLFVSTRREVQGAVAELRDLAERGEGAAAGAAAVDQGDRDHLLELANDAPTIRFVDAILAHAVERHATDIHLEPFDQKARIRMRIDGLLHEDLTLPASLYPGVISRLKILAGIDIGERRLPQDGRIRHKTQGEPLDIRVSTVPSVHGESMAMRLLDLRDVAGRIEALRMPPDVDRSYRWGLNQRSGLVVVTGPTGSGKTTTLHALLSELNDARRKIVTVENPVEIRIPGIVQVEANPEIGLTFAQALRTFLRQDPDIIMVGEIRDRETASVAVQAALTGHVVLSTLHTNDAPTAIPRLVDMGVEPYLVRAVLKLAGAQRLVRSLCPACAVPSDDRQDLAVLERHAGWLPPAAEWRLHRAAGCQACGQSGYRGRRAVFEAIGGAELHEVAADRTRPWRPMLAHGLTLAAQGETSIEEILRVLDVEAG